MAMRMLPGGVPEFDTVEEMIAYQRAMGQTGPIAAAPPRATPGRAPQAASAETRAAAMALLSAYGAGAPTPGVVGRGGGRGRGAAKRQFTVDPAKAGGPVSPGQGKMITRSIGGLKHLCGGEAAAKAARDGDLYSSDILTRMGLTYGTASAVISEMMQQDVGSFNLDESKPDQAANAAKAREILFQIGGVTCPPRTNPRRW